MTVTVGGAWGASSWVGRKGSQGRDFKEKGPMDMVSTTSVGSGRFWWWVKGGACVAELREGEVRKQIRRHR